MGIFNIFKKEKRDSEALEHASVTLYPEKILIHTYDRAKEGLWMGTNNFGFIAADSSDELLGSTIRYYMNLTRIGQNRPQDWQVAHKAFLKTAGFKTQKEEYKDAKNVGVSLKGTAITINISVNGEYNGKTRGFWGNGSLTYDNSISDAELGQRVREGLGLCQ